MPTDPASAIDAARGWGDQLPALGLGLLGMGALVYFFLQHLAAREESSKVERAARDALFAGAIEAVTLRADATAKVCHETQRAATERERETAEVLGGVRAALERNTTATMDCGRIVEEARREIERARILDGRAA